MTIPLIFFERLFVALLLFSNPSPIQRWEGNWKGELQIFTAEGLKQTTQMQLLIAPTTTENQWQWTIIYGQGEKQDLRAYLLKLPDVNKPTEFLIDEQNSISLQAHLIGDALYSNFEVSNSGILSVYRLNTATEKPYISFEIFFSQMNNPTLTGGGEEDIPMVRTFPVVVYQKAILYLEQ